MFPGLALFTVAASRLMHSLRTSSRCSACRLTLLVTLGIALGCACSLTSLLVVLLRLKGGIP